MTDPRFLVTNDDGIDAPGIAALREELTALGEVTVVAPDGERSGSGRTRTHAVVRREHPWGYTLSGTPADCVAYGLRGLDTEFDLVVAGVNDGPNAGNYVVGRSGTVGASIEAAFLGTPALSISAYHARDFFPHPPEEYDFSRPARIATTLIERGLERGAFELVDVLNVNAPVDVPGPRVRLTDSLPDYDLRVEHDADPDAVDEDVADDEGGEVVRLRDEVWPGVVGFENPFPLSDDVRERYPLGTDRRAMIDGEVSVSPLSVSHDAEDVRGELAEIVESVETT